MEYIPALLRFTTIAILFFAVILFLEAWQHKNKLHMFICVVMAVIAGFLYPPAPAEQPVPRNEQHDFINEQMNIANWYNDYKKFVDELNNNWYLYNKTVQAFANDEISVQTARVRISELYANSQELKARLNLMAIPSDLSDDNHNLVLKILNTTKAYAAEQNSIFEQSVYAVDANNIALYPEHNAQVYNLQRIMIINNPLTLDTAGDIATLKDNLR